MRYPEEPHVIVGSVLVHQGAIWMLEMLLATGHHVQLVDDVVVVDQVNDLTENQRYLLEAFEEDLEILLRAGGPTVH